MEVTSLVAIDVTCLRAESLCELFDDVPPPRLLWTLAISEFQFRNSSPTLS